VSIAFQLVMMRDLEKFLGWLRICIVYCVCGIAGSLGSAIFIPYHIEVSDLVRSFLKFHFS
jgi:membrane associated rhomboid family serine protease